MALPQDEGSELLTIKAFHTTPEKVDRVCFHPVQPLLAYYERSNTVTVWNYESNEVVYTNQMGGADEAALQEVTLWQRAEKEAVALGSKPSDPPSPAEENSLTAKNTASGSIQDLVFFDLDTCFWQMAQQYSLQFGASDASAIPSLAKIRKLYGHRWIVAACDNKVTLHDLSSPATLDLPRAAAFESKAPTRLAFLLMNFPSLTGGINGSSSGSLPELTPILVVGTASGSIYLIDPNSGVNYGKLTDAHKSSITALVPLASEKLGGPDRLVSADASGYVAIWDPSRTPARGPDREISPQRTFKAHDSAVKSAALYFAYSNGEAPEALPPRLVTVGDDKKVALWDIATWQCVNRVQPLQKASCHSVGFAPWGGAGLGVHPSLILASGESTSIMGLHPATGDVSPLLDIMGRVDVGQKKAPKIYHLAAHPTRPHLLAMAVNTGAGLLTFDPNERPAVVALPAQVITLEALMHQQEAEEQDKVAGPAGAGASNGKAPASKGAAGFTYVMATGGSLWSTALRIETQSRESGGERSVTLASGSKEEIAKLDLPGRPQLACSASGRSISAVWPESKVYAIYSLAPTGAWEVIDRGAGSCVVWSSVAPMYALISTPNMPVMETKAKKGLLQNLGFGAKKAAEEEEAALEAALRAAAAATSVAVHVVDESNGSQFVASHQIQLLGAQPQVLHGGALLGVVALHPETLDRYLQFFSWKDFSPVGHPLPEPVWIGWEPECTLAVLAYEHAVELCRTRPCFERFATLAIPGSYAGIWQSRQLYLATHNALHLVFADPVQEFVQELTLASFNGGVASKTAPPLEATPLPPEQMRPVGPLTLAGVRHSYLWLADGFGRPFIVSLRHPGIRYRCLAARGELTTARTIAERGLSASFNDDVARFLAAMSPKDGVKEALLLQGLSPAAELALCIRDGNWNRAARCFQALALGVSDKTLLNASTERVLEEAAAAGTFAGFDALSVADRIAALTISNTYGETQVSEVSRILDEHSRGIVTTIEDVNGPQSPRSGDDNASEANEEADEEGGEVPDPVDWEAALNSTTNGTAQFDSDENGNYVGGELEEDRTAAKDAVAVGSGVAVSPADARRVAYVTELGIRFADAATVAGNDDAARSALGVLVRYAPVLPPILLQDLINRIGQCKMTESARNLAQAAADAPPGSPLRDPGVAALLAALVGGMHGAAVQGTLHAAGLAPLSAVYAAVWGQGSEEQALGMWKSQLGVGAGAGQVAIARPTA